MSFDFKRAKHNLNVALAAAATYFIASGFNHKGIEVPSDLVIPAPVAISSEDFAGITANPAIVWVYKDKGVNINPEHKPGWAPAPLIG
jgi:hypothetical protein